jgi:hypothetical protein
MDKISKEDIAFLDTFLDDELTEEGLIELDRKLENPNFKKYYNKRLDQKYKLSPIKLFMSYLPMLLLLGLLAVGIYLITQKM